MGLRGATRSPPTQDAQLLRPGLLDVTNQTLVGVVPGVPKTASHVLDHAVAVLRRGGVVTIDSVATRSRTEQGRGGSPLRHQGRTHGRRGRPSDGPKGRPSSLQLWGHPRTRSSDCVRASTSASSPTSTAEILRCLPTWSYPRGSPLGGGNDYGRGSAPARRALRRSRRRSKPHASLLTGRGPIRPRAC